MCALVRLLTYARCHMRALIAVLSCVCVLSYVHCAQCSHVFGRICVRLYLRSHASALIHALTHMCARVWLFKHVGSRMRLLICAQLALKESSHYLFSHVLLQVALLCVLMSAPSYPRSRARTFMRVCSHACALTFEL